MAALIAYNVFAETWSGIMITIIIEIVPNEIKQACIVIFLFVINNIGGNLPILLTEIRKIMDYKEAIYLMWSGLLALSGILFFVAGIPHLIQQKRKLQN